MRRHHIRMPARIGAPSKLALPNSFELAAAYRSAGQVGCGYVQVAVRTCLRRSASFRCVQLRPASFSFRWVRPGASDDDQERPPASRAQSSPEAMDAVPTISKDWVYLPRLEYRGAAFSTGAFQAFACSCEPSRL